MTVPPATVRCPRAVAERIRASARRALPHEACGVLGGSRHDGLLVLTHWFELSSEAPAADAFAVDPVAFALAEARLRAEGTSWLGFAHSHPHDQAVPSARDLDQLWRNCLQVVVGGAELRDMRAFWLHEAGAVALHWEESLP